MKKIGTLFIKILGIFAIFLITAIFLFTANAARTNAPLFTGIKDITRKYLMAPAESGQAQSSYLKGEDNDRINAVLMGIGGENHEGGDLTDTIIVASYRPSDDTLALMSLPRDLVVYIPDYAWRKINHYYFFAEQEEAGSGPAKTAEFIGDILDLPIHYHATVNFNGFAEFIDALDGVEVNVENTLDDYQYPIKGRENAEPESSRYEHLHIEKGLQQFDGELALKYVRSRHALGIEGSDYARSRRQQLMISAIKDKVFSLGTLANPGKLIDIINVVNDNLVTNLEISEIYRGITVVKDFQTDNIVNRVIDASPEGPLIENEYNGAFVLETKTGDFEELKFIAQNIFNPEKNYSRAHYQKNSLELAEENKALQPERDEAATILGSPKKPTIEIRNGTLISGFAAQHAEELRELGFSIELIGNAQNQNLRESFLYQVDPNALPAAAKSLADKYSLDIISDLPDNIPETEAEFLLILGPDTFY